MKRLIAGYQNLDIGTPPKDRFQYQSLEGSRDIRLVKILPSSPLTSVKCQLEIFSLDEKPEYLALSYCWGTRVDKTWVSCNGSRLDITKDLLTAIRRFRNKETPVLFWIDQICINQESPEERRHQVGMMVDIYRNAKTVCIWLGPEADNSSLAIDCISRVKKVFDQYEDLTHLDSCEFESMVKRGLPSRTAKEWQALTLLLRRHWFGRIWIVQEASTASTAKVVCGRNEIAWDLFAGVVQQVMMLGHKFEGFLPTTHWRFLYLMKIRSDFQGAGNCSIYSLLRCCRYFNATDDRDKIYALLGLNTTRKLNVSADNTVDADYTIDVRDLYRKFARALLFHKHSPRTGDVNWDRHHAIMMLSEAAGRMTDSPLPSWVPDWREANPSTFRLMGGSSHPLYKAAGDSKFSIKSMYPDLNRIRLRGKIFDSVQLISSIGPSRPQGELDTALKYLGAERVFWEDLRSNSWALNCWINETSGMASTCHHYPLEERYMAHCRTLICNFKTTCDVIKGTCNEPDYDQDYWHTRQLLAIVYPNGIMNGAPLECLAHVVLPHIAGFSRWELVHQSFGSERRFFTSLGGFMGLGSANMQPGDLVCVLTGSPVPWLIRRDGDDYVLIGECYVHSIMNGEVMETEALPVQDIVLK